MLVILSLALSLAPVLADPIDWVPPVYALRATGDPRTAAAQRTILQLAQDTLSVGPFTLTNTTILPPSKDKHDYLSWAPYHWPNCNWCKSASVAAAPPPPPSPTTSKPAWAQALGNFYEGDDPAYTPPPLNVALPTAKSGSDRVAAGRNGAKKPAPSKTTAPSCTPSPTRSLAPSATWTTCPYVVRDGQVNPDVRTLPGMPALQTTTQLAVWHALAAVLAPAPANASAYAQHAAALLRTFFVTPATRANPNANFGQMVRGPGQTTGAYMGVLDWRGMVQAANAVLVLRAARAPAWDATTDAGIVGWARNYSTWLTQSPLAVRASQSPNNHGSFYAAQLAAVRLLANDTAGAGSALKAYFGGAFKGQIAANGEQPLEAARTRPFHYRCFNLEAMIACAKLGDFLGLNFWTAKSKEGATIRDAVEYAMGLEPGNEDGTELLPHVAAVAAAYGDAKGTYAAFLARRDAQFAQSTYWFYDQPGAMGGSGGR